MQQQAVLLACSTEGNITAWDLATASQLTQFKHNACGRGRLCRVGSDYLAAAQSGKDSLHFWAWHKEQVVQRCFTQEQLTALAASPDGCYLAGGGASGTLYCWEAATGRLLRSWPGHYKAVSCLAFSDGGGLLVSGGEDTMVCAWLLAEVLDDRSDALGAAAAMAAGTARVEPLHAWSEHTLPVTGLHVGFGGAGALLATASLDRTVKLWSLASGQLLRTVALPAGVTAVALDAGEHLLLAGCADGGIWEAPLAGQPPAGGAAGSSGGAAAAAGLVGGAGSCCYEGHTKAISSLCITPDGEQLVSGSEDGSARVWDLRSRQCLRVLHSPGKAPVSCALLVAWPTHLAGLGKHSSAGARQGPKRPQPLAPLAKFAGASGAGGAALRPWEGAPAIADGSLLGNGVRVGLLPDPLTPLEALQQQLAATTAAAAAGGFDEVALQVATAAAAPLAAAAGGSPAAATADAEQLRTLVEQLRQQLRESQQVARQWQALHGELHQFCAEHVLAGGAKPPG